MTTHGIASPRKQELHATRTSPRKQEPQATRTSRTNTSRTNGSRANGSIASTSRTNTILNTLTRRAQAILNDQSIDANSRAIIRHALEINDPWLAKLVKRAEAGESFIDANGFSGTSKIINRDSSAEKIEALAEMICRSGGESSAALFVLMATLQDATNPPALAHSLKHFAFTRCGEFNFGRMVDTQVAVLERYLLAGNSIET